LAAFGGADGNDDLSAVGCRLHGVLAGCAFKQLLAMRLAR
jgi:hypothetical protein